MWVGDLAPSSTAVGARNGDREDEVDERDDGGEDGAEDPRAVLPFSG